MRKGVVVVLLILILVLGLYTPENLGPSSVAPNRGIESPFETFTTASDGAESTASINSFSETLSDDVLFAPDVWENTTPETADSGVHYVGSTGSGDYTDTKVWAGSWSIAPVGDVTNTSVTVPVPVNIEGMKIAAYCYPNENADVAKDVYLRKDDNSYTDFGDMGYGGAPAWVNFTTYDSDYWNATHVEILFYAEDTTPLTGTQLDYVEVQFYFMTLAESGFGESFAAVEDWTTSDTSISSDGDVATITENGAGSTGRAYASFSSTDFFEFYYEFRIVSMTATTANLEFWDGADYHTLKTFTAAGTFKGLISDADASTMERIGFLVGSEGGNIKPDYLRIGPADEMGWQHDGSTTEAVSGIDDTNFDYVFSTDGDILNITTTVDTGASLNGDTQLVYDTTSTAINLEDSYYPFIEMNYSCSIEGGGYYMYTRYGGKTVTVVLTTGGTWNILRVNVAAGISTSNADILLRYYRNGIGATANLLIDYIKAYSIANFTVTQSSVDVDDFLYVDSGVLHSNIDTGYIEADHDPALSVNAATFNVWNITTQTTAPQSAYYVAAWSDYSSESRGSLTSGTLTDLKLNFTTDTTIAAITFIEDGTNPTVIRSNVNPPEPDDDETVTLSSVITDGVEVYSVKYNALVYPAGFSDVDYSATETATNFWTYSFSSGVLPTGYYSFSVVANDGANENDLLTEPEYIDFTVRVSEIRITPITFFGVGDDFSQMQISFEINKDCTFTIYEASDSVAETDTHTGSVSEGWDNIAWDKLTTTDTAVNFSISFVSGSLSTWINGSYAVAQVTFDVVLSDKTTTFDYVYLEGESTKAAAYAVYDINNVLRSSGTIPEGSFALSFEIWNKKSLTETFYGVKFTNGSSTDWINGTYYADDPEEYKGGGVVTVPPWWQDPMTWVIIGGGFALVMIARSEGKEGKLPNAPKGLK